MTELIISSLYFIIPAYIANMCPVIFGKLPLPLAVSINKKLFGANKTWRGFYVSYIGALAGLLIQMGLFNKGILVEYSLLDYSEINIFLYAFLFGIGAITGDLIKSFVKRRIGIKPGRPWVPFDQIDFIIGAYLFLLPLYVLPWQNLLFLLIITPLLHFITNVIGYFVGLKKVWW